MGGPSKIEWTERTWNPIVGCSIVSPGCTNCYAMKMAARIEAMGNQPRYAGTTTKVKGNAVWNGKLAQAPDSTLLEPLRRKKATIYFVNSMGDLFHESIPDEWIDRVFAVMALSPQHTFQVLTKRAERMQAYVMSRHGLSGNIGGSAVEIMVEHTSTTSGGVKTTNPIEAYRYRDIVIDRVRAVLPNVWLGVSAERQQEADERIPRLLQTPAAVRFVSAEPLLGPIDFTDLDPHDGCPSLNCLGAGGLDWIIVGGESGQNARPMHPQWAREIRDQCEAAGAAFFFKQRGEWASAKGYPGHMPIGHVFDDGYQMIRVGKKAAGRLLDGVEHNGMPTR